MGPVSRCVWVEGEMCNAKEEKQESRIAVLYRIVILNAAPG
jgi:hypothetical protein